MSSHRGWTANTVQRTSVCTLCLICNPVHVFVCDVCCFALCSSVCLALFQFVVLCPTHPHQGPSANVLEKFKQFGIALDFGFLGEVSILLHAMWLVGFPSMKIIPNFAMLKIEMRKTVLIENIKAFKKAIEEVQLETPKLL